MEEAFRDDTVLYKVTKAKLIGSLRISRTNRGTKRKVILILVFLTMGNVVQRKTKNRKQSKSVNVVTSIKKWKHKEVESFIEMLEERLPDRI